MQQMFLTIGKGMAVVYLVWAVLWDIRKRIVPVAWIRLGLFAAVGLRILIMGAGTEAMAVELSEAFFSIIPGVALLLAGYFTGESVGYADGWSVFLLGLLLGAGAAVCIVMAAFFFSAFYALWLIVAKKADKRMRFAFLPHISAGFIVWMMVF